MVNPGRSPDRFVHPAPPHGRTPCFRARDPKRGMPWGRTVGTWQVVRSSWRRRRPRAGGSIAASSESNRARRMTTVLARWWAPQVSPEPRLRGICGSGRPRSRVRPAVASRSGRAPCPSDSAGSTLPNNPQFRLATAQPGSGYYRATRVGLLPGIPVGFRTTRVELLPTSSCWPGRLHGARSVRDSKWTAEVPGQQPMRASSMTMSSMKRVAAPPVSTAPKWTSTSRQRSPPLTGPARRTELPSIHSSTVPAGA